MAPTSTPTPEKEQKARNQRSVLRNRIKAIATDIMNGRFNSVQAPYRPNEIQDAENLEWKTLSKNQDTLIKRINAAKDAMDGGYSKQELIFSLREDFPEIAKKIPEPVRKAPPAPPAPAPHPDTSSKRPHPRDEEDEDDDELYDPAADGRAQREERAAKRQRAAPVAEPKEPMDDDEADLQMQIQEIQMKADLQIHQLKRKFAADKKKREAAEARKIKVEIKD